AKLEILELSFRHFCDRDLTHGSERANAFRGFVANGGRLLRMHARFDALDAHLRAALGAESGWLNWPEEFRDPEGPAVERFAAENARQVEFYAYLQWLAHEQLASAQTLAC